MKKTVTLFLSFMFVYAGFGQNIYTKKGMKFPNVVCYGLNESHPSHIGPPKEYYQHLKSASTQKANIEVTYVGFSEEAQQAFQYAVDIWESLIYSPVTIRLQANWETLGSNVLGNCGSNGYYINFNATEKQNCFYTVALAEKMLGEDLNGVGQFDIIATFNKNVNWYLGIDGNTPLQQYDFASTVLHELTHGLGFIGNSYSQSGKGGYAYGSDELPGIFDNYVTDKNKINLVNTSIYVNPSIKLNLAFTSGWLEFGVKQEDDKFPRLYAPSTWKPGSSMYHLDDVSYPVGDPNSLMTYAAGTGESIHDPGPYTLSMMYEMGWKSISIKHRQLKDVEYASVPFDFNAVIKSDYDLDSSKVFLVYSVNQFTKSDSVLLKATDIPANFSAQLSNIQSKEVDYYFSATDKKNRRFVFPSGAPSQFFSFKIGPDNISPVVTYEPIKYMILSDPSAKIDAVVTDNLGIKSVTLEYFINGGPINEISLLNDSADRYTGNLIFSPGTVKDGDKISYRVVAVDASSKSNTGKSPLSGYDDFLIKEIQKPVDKYVNNFDLPTNDFICPDFNVSTVTGFDSPALNSAHPYLSPDVDNKNFNFITLLRYPIILKAGGKMSYDEIVLVEPGDAGTKFGDTNFYDYVIVEGSKDGVTNWKPLINGYDSNIKKSWYALFTGSMLNNNSTAVPTKNAFVRREFELLANGNFNAGDTIQIRFRLFSDPYSNGWGWIIDNLAIQDLGTAVKSLAISSGDVIFYPNPASDRLNVQIQTNNKIEKLVMKTYNSSGQLVYNQQFAVGSNSFQTEMDVRKFNPGLYLITIEPENGQVITRKILIR